MRAWAETYGLPTVMSNCSNNYGPYHFPEKLVPVVILRALGGQPIPIYGAGENVRDWLYVEDHAEALLTVIRRRNEVAPASTSPGTWQRPSTQTSPDGHSIGSVWQRKPGPSSSTDTTQAPSEMISIASKWRILRIIEGTTRHRESRCRLAP